jgi:hypothetical protein
VEWAQDHDANAKLCRRCVHAVFTVLVQRLCIVRAATGPLGPIRLVGTTHSALSCFILNSACGHAFTCPVFVSVVVGPDEIQMCQEMEETLHLAGVHFKACHVVSAAFCFSLVECPFLFRSTRDRAERWSVCSSISVDMFLLVRVGWQRSSASPNNLIVLYGATTRALVR